MFLEAININYSLIDKKKVLDCIQFDKDAMHRNMYYILYIVFYNNIYYSRYIIVISIEYCIFNNIYIK